MASNRSARRVLLCLVTAAQHRVQRDREPLDFRR